MIMLAITTDFIVNEIVCPIRIRNNSSCVWDVRIVLTVSSFCERLCKTGCEIDENELKNVFRQSRLLIIGKVEVDDTSQQAIRQELVVSQKDVYFRQLCDVVYSKYTNG